MTTFDLDPEFDDEELAVLYDCGPDWDEPTERPVHDLPDIGTWSAPVPQPIVLQVVRYRCPFCTRARAKKTAATEHIARCWNNPAAKACKTCIHYEPGEDGLYPGHPGFPETCGVERDLTRGLHTNCDSHQIKRESQ